MTDLTPNEKLKRLYRETFPNDKCASRSHNFMMLKVAKALDIEIAQCKKCKRFKTLRHFGYRMTTGCNRTIQSWCSRCRNPRVGEQ